MLYKKQADRNMYLYKNNTTCTRVNRWYDIIHFIHLMVFISHKKWKNESFVVVIENVYFVINILMLIKFAFINQCSWPRYSASFYVSVTTFIVSFDIYYLLSLCPRYNMKWHSPSKEHTSYKINDLLWIAQWSAELKTTFDIV